MNIPAYLIQVASGKMDMMMGAIIMDKCLVVSSTVRDWLKMNVSRFYLNVLGL